MSLHLTKNIRELLKLDVPKIIFSNNLFKNLSFQQNRLKKPVEKLNFSDVEGLKYVTLLKNESFYYEPLSDVILGTSLLRLNLRLC